MPPVVNNNSPGGASYQASGAQDGRLLLFFVLVFLGLVFTYAVLSESVSSDDDLGHYLMAKAALSEPSYYLNLWGRPLFTVLYSVPAQLGFWGMRILTIVVCCATLYSSFRAVQALGFRNPEHIAILIGFQPLFFHLSFSAQTEPLCALVVSIALLAWSRNRYLLMTLAASLIPLARLEVGMLLPLFAVILIEKKKISLLPLLALPVLVWNATGFLVHGDPLWLVHQAAGGGTLYSRSSFWHYFERYMYIVGPLVFTFVVIGLLDDVKKRRLTILNVGFAVMFLVYSYASWRSAGNAAGFIRHFVSISPIMGMLALQGVNRITSPTEGKNWDLLAGLSISLLTSILLSRKLLMDFFISDQTEYFKLGIVMALFGFWVVQSLGNLPSGSRTIYWIWTVLIVGSSVFYTLNDRKPMSLSDETKMMKDIAAWYVENGYGSRQTLVNHIWFDFFIDANPYDKRTSEQFPPLTLKNLQKAPVGSIAVWESHYGRRLLGDVPADFFSNNENFRILRQEILPDSRFAVIVAEKMREFREPR